MKEICPVTFRGCDDTGCTTGSCALKRESSLAVYTGQSISGKPNYEDYLPKYTEGVKHDTGKPRPELIAPEIIEALGVILEFGAKKYEDRNWEKGMKWSRPFGALMRHMWEWWKGNDKDEETGKSHLWHAACCLMFLIAYEQRKIGTDDRP